MRGTRSISHSHDDATTILFAFLAAGSFTVGNLSAAGPAVTWWSSEWSSLNGLSGGPATSSFKGFINGPSTQPPVCGGTWTTANGGNSTDPPPASAIPAYMGVVVTSNVTKSGNTTSGNIVSIIVVQTNGGYAPNPGHPGTGTVIATYCP